MLFPNISDYKNAIVIPESFATLGNLRPENGLLGDIYFSSGNFAVVFKMRDVQTGKLHAVKCFTREQERRTESLDNISRYLGTSRSPYIVPYTFLKDEIWVNDAEYPVLLMDWVDGVTLGEKVKTLCAVRDTAGLHRLTVAFAEMALSLLEQDWAHGDLKHDNIMVRPDDSLALVDYDGCFVPSMSGQNAREIGSPCYRHPKRTAQHFDRHIDDFSILVIFLSLRALSQNPDLFESHQNGENLLFSVADLALPQASGIVSQLRRDLDSYVQGSVALLDFSVAMGNMAFFGLRDGVLKVFFEGFKGDLLLKKVVLRCKNWHGEEVVLEVDRDMTSLRFSFNHLTSLPTEIGRLTNLRNLELNGNKLTNLPTEIGWLTNLTNLDLYGNKLTNLPTEIGWLTNLTNLDLSNNHLTNLPSEIGRLTNLTNLDLYNNKLTKLPAEIGRLTNLTSLNLWSNQLTSLPSEIGRLTNLTNLDLSNNHLTNLPSEIGRLTNLTSLGLGSNHLTNLPSEIGRLTNLTSLNLSSNQLTSLPAEIVHLRNLTSLDLSSNQLRTLPNEIVRLTNLTLGLDANQLVTLITILEKIPNLKLDLNFYELTILPSEIGRLTNLTSLDLIGNKLSNFEKEKIEQLLPNCNIYF